MAQEHMHAARQMGGPEAPIGIFDSGVGGLTVVKEMLAQLPGEDLVYFGDTARVPYGNKSGETVLAYSRQIVDFLTDRGVKAVVIACNTASAHALEALQRERDLPIMGVISPGVAEAIDRSPGGRIGVIGTEGTIGSGMYERQLRSVNPKVQVFGKACPLFCPLIEEGMGEDGLTREMARRYLEPLQREGIDSLILGCTHYPLIQPLLEELLGPEVVLVNPAARVARELKSMLADRQLLSSRQRGGVCYFYVSDGSGRFDRFAQEWLGRPVASRLREWGGL